MANGGVKPLGMDPAPQPDPEDPSSRTESAPTTPPARPPLWRRPMRYVAGLTIPSALLRAFEYRALAVIVYVEVLVSIGILALHFKLGLAGRFVIPALMVYGLLVIVFDVMVIRQIESPVVMKPGGVLYSAMTFGAALLFIIPLLVAYAVLIRASDTHPVFASVLFVAIAVFGWLFWRAASGAYKAGRAPWVSFGTALVVIPLVLGWTAGSLVWSFWGAHLESDVPGSGRTGASLTARLVASAERWVTQCGGKAVLEGTDRRPIRVAVALSGGGYRAAVTHAGLLAALEEACIPLEYLSTVSGGSIIGAYYALGFPPERFAGKLAQGKPGLPNDEMILTALFASWFDDTASSADTYSAHFQRVYFGHARLSDLAPPSSRPLLLVNATDLQGDGDTAREVFFRGRGPGLDHTLVADLVAASGAFPGAFEPKRLSWAPSTAPVAGNIQPQLREFIDGGVVENLGVEGLRRYLTLPRSGQPLPPRPHVLIISDASQYTSTAKFGAKTEIISLLTRAEGISWSALHRHIYARFTGEERYLSVFAKVEPETQVASANYEALLPRGSPGDPVRLQTVVVPLTAPETSAFLNSWYPTCAFSKTGPAAAIQKDVAGYRTLNELDSEEVYRAYWLGFVLGRIYRPAIECARAKASDPSYQCPLKPRRDADLKCPSRDEIVQGLKRAAQT